MGLGKKVKISKNRKKYWRKHVNLKDVEEFLEEKRQDERFGGAVQDKPDQQLFVVDNKGDSDLQPTFKSHLSKLRCFQILQPDSAVPPAIKPPHHQGSKGKQKPEPSWTADKKPKQKRKDSSVVGDTKGRGQKQPYDLWSSGAAESAKKSTTVGVDSSYLPDTVTRTTIKVPEYRYQKPSLLPAVETPHPGASYNPRYADHQALLLEAHQTEVKRKKEEDRLERSLTDKFPKDHRPQETWLQEMSAGLFDGEKGGEEQGEGEGEVLPPVVKTWGRPVSFQDRKTKADKNLDEVRRREKRKVLLEKVQKRRLNDVNSLKALKRQIVKAEEVSEVRKKKSEQKVAESMYRAGRLGPCKYVAPDLEILLGEELPDNLRTLKMEGHLMDDRFKSLQRRNLIEPRTRQKGKKKKVKVFVKRSHRDGN